MRARLTVLPFLVLFATVVAAQLQSASRSPRMSPDEDVAASLSAGGIIDRAIELARLQDEASAELHYRSLVATTVHSLNSVGEATKTETTLHNRYSVEGVLYEELIERDGRPLTEKEIREEQGNREKFTREVRDKAARGKDIETNDERQIRLDLDLIDRYQISFVGVEDVRGEPCWVLSFEPRPGKLPEETRMDKALNRSSGRLYISQRDHGTTRVEFEMGEPIRYGFLATLKSATGRLEFERIEPDVWLPQRFDCVLDLRVFFRNRHLRVVREWSSVSGWTRVACRSGSVMDEVARGRSVERTDPDPYAAEQLISSPQHSGDLILPCPSGHFAMSTLDPLSRVSVS